MPRIVALLAVVCLVSAEDPASEWVLQGPIEDGKVNEADARSGLMAVRIEGRKLVCIQVIRDGEFLGIEHGKVRAQEGKRVDEVRLEASRQDGAKWTEFKLLGLSTNGVPATTEAVEAARNDPASRPMALEIEPGRTLTLSSLGKDGTVEMALRFVPGTVAAVVDGKLANTKVTGIPHLQITQRYQRIVLTFSGKISDEALKKISSDLDDVYDITLKPIRDPALLKQGRIGFYFLPISDRDMVKQLKETVRDVYRGDEAGGVKFEAETIEECSAAEDKRLHADD